MPQGKGTYGSKVGRPPKKKYQAGGSVDPFSTRNPAGIPAKMDMEAIEEQNDSPIPTSNAMDRSEVSPMGAEVGTGVYAEGGRIGRAKLPSESGRKKMAAAFEDYLSRKKKRESKPGVKTDVSKAPKYKGAPLPPKRKKSKRQELLEKMGKLGSSPQGGKWERRKK